MKKLVALVALPTKLVTGEGEIRAKFKYPFTFWVDSRGGAELGVAKRNETEVRLRQVLVNLSELSDLSLFSDRYDFFNESCIFKS